MKSHYETYSDANQLRTKHKVKGIRTSLFSITCPVAQSIGGPMTHIDSRHNLIMVLSTEIEHVDFGTKRAFQALARRLSTMILEVMMLDQASEKDEESRPDVRLILPSGDRLRQVYRGVSAAAAFLYPLAPNPASIGCRSMCSSSLLITASKSILSFKFTALPPFCRPRLGAKHGGL